MPARHVPGLQNRAPWLCQSVHGEGPPVKALTINARLILASLLVFVLTISIGVTAWHALRQVSDRVVSIQMNGVSGTASLAKAQDAMWKLRYGIAQYIAIPDPDSRKKIVDDSPGQFATLDEAITGLEKTALTDELKSALAEFNAAYQPYKRDRPQWLSLMDAGKIDEAKEFRSRTILISGAGTVKALTRLVELQAKRSDQDRITAETEATDAAWLVWAVAVPISLLVFIFLWWVRRSIMAPLARAVQVADSIAAGRLDSEIELRGSDETATLLRALSSMQGHLLERNHREHQAVEEMTRIKIALDCVSIPVRIADPAGQVIYANGALLQVLRQLEPALRTQNPAFRSESFIGSSIGTLYADAATALRKLAAQTAAMDTVMDIGGRTYRVVTSPVFDARGERLGSVGEWQDMTEQLLAEKEISAIVSDAVAGHLDHRIDPDGKEGFFLTLARGINDLLDATRHALQSTSDVLSRVAQGDLTQTIQTSYAGIFGQLKDDTNSTIERLREVVGRIKTASDAINTGAREIAAGNQNLSSRTEQQASSLEETASSMEQLNAMVKQNAENAQEANELARLSNEVASRGGELVKGVVSTMGDIQASSRKIADIIGVVDSIAFQTNILALNAAVEAARAGEQGRGFAVVASEVRTLAQKSATAAKEIKALIADSVGKVDGGARLVQQAGSTIDEVVVSCQRVATLVTAISAASREQSSGIEQVTRAVSEMDDMTQQNSALVEQAAAAAEGLEEQAQGLVRAVGSFHLAEGSPASKPSHLATRAGRAPAKPQKQLPPPRPEDDWAEF